MQLIDRKKKNYLGFSSFCKKISHAIYLGPKYMDVKKSVLVPNER